MALTPTTRFSNITLTYILGTNLIQDIEGSTADGEHFSIYFGPGGADPEMGTQDAADLAIMRAINAHPGFMDADGNFPTFGMNPYLGWSNADDIVAPWQNPFVPTIDGEQSFPGGGAAELGTRFYRRALTDTSLAAPTVPSSWVDPDGAVRKNIDSMVTLTGTIPDTIDFATGSWIDDLPDS